MKFYLSHPFQSRKEVRSWELWIEMTTGLVLVNPFYDLQRGDMPALDDPATSREARSRAISDFKALVNRDLDALFQCDAVVCVLPENTPAIGTICEAWEACNLEIPIYFITSEETAAHPWVRFMVERTGGAVFNTVESFRDSFLPKDVLRWIEQIHNTAWENVAREGLDG